jgi:hypothetical protein
MFKITTFSKDWSDLRRSLGSASLNLLIFNDIAIIKIFELIIINHLASIRVKTIEDFKIEPVFTVSLIFGKNKFSKSHFYNNLLIIS